MSPMSFLINKLKSPMLFTFKKFYVLQFHVENKIAFVYGPLVTSNITE